MAKKNTKNSKPVQVDMPELTVTPEAIETVSNDINTQNYDVTATKDVDVSFVSLRPNGTNISELNITELISLEKACALVCKRFETIAQLDFTNNNKFKEYQHYYELIFNELEKRVAESCNNK